MGRQPQVYIADPELIRLVFVKDFVYFGDRQDMDLGTDMVNEIMDFQPGTILKNIIKQNLITRNYLDDYHHQREILLLQKEFFPLSFTTFLMQTKS